MKRVGHLLVVRPLIGLFTLFLDLSQFSRGQVFGKYNVSSDREFLRNRIVLYWCLAFLLGVIDPSHTIIMASPMVAEVDDWIIFNGVMKHVHQGGAAHLVHEDVELALLS